MKFKMGEYLDKLIKEDLVVSYCLYHSFDEEIQFVTYDSKKSIGGTLFVCKGAAFRTSYLEDAKSRGAVCYVAETQHEVEGELPYIIVRNVRKAMPVLAKMFYGCPQERIHLTGITGTKGKTTTAYYLKGILDAWERMKMHPSTGILSSIENYDGKTREESKLTTPESLELYRHLKNGADCRLKYMTMEVSSQALKYHRVRGVSFDVGIFLNISEDHISPAEHEDFEDYFSSKLSIFRQSKIACINTDSDHFERIRRTAKITEKVVTFGTKGQPQILGYDIRRKNGELVFRAVCDRFDEEFKLSMPGMFNVENALAAIAAAYCYRVPVSCIKEGLSQTKVKGRMEEYASNTSNLKVIVDYAHNKLSFEKIFDSVLNEYPGYRIVSVFGCPGNKALNRRKDLGLVAGLFSSMVYLSADDPAEESVDKISREIGTYLENVGCPYECIEDRGEAIRRAIREADEKTVILVLGKGNETTQKYGKFNYQYPTDAQLVCQSLKEYDSRMIYMTNHEYCYGKVQIV